MNRYKDKYFSILGDSISTFEGYSEPKDAEYYDWGYKMRSGIFALADTWWGQVIERLNGRFLRNNSISGSTVCWHPAYEVPSYGCSDERTAALDKEGISPDVIMVFLGTNDWGAGIAVKCANATKGEENNLAIFTNAYRKMLEKLKKNYPNAEIWCFTLPISCCSAMSNFEFPYYYGGRHIAEYCEAIEESAKAYGCCLIDLYRYGTSHDTMDGFHPNVNGMKTLADGVINGLNEE
ncbi:MAG: hypothetical protein IKA57_05965 [Clostridia bacterium]|nr:hypothetical protein [Clostridia bacterium]